MAIEEEFSIEIPDKEADAIHSGKECQVSLETVSNRTQSTKQLHTSWPSQMRTDGLFLGLV